MITDPIDACRFHLHDSVAPLRFTDAQIEEFLDMEKVPDVDGYHPLETGYTPTYNVVRAAGRGWLWLAGCVGNTAMYKTGDLTVNYDVDYCLRRAHDLLGSSVSIATRADEPYREFHREAYHDGDDPRYR